jgi:hypothetical protein
MVMPLLSEASSANFGRSASPRPTSKQTGRNPSWDRVRFPDVANSAGKGLAEVEDYARGAGWTSAPSTSHVHSFRLFLGTDRARDVLGGYSTIQVRFKARVNGKLTNQANSVYTYRWRTRSDADLAWSKITSAHHPGELVYDPRLWSPGLIDYSRDAGSQEGE